MLAPEHERKLAEVTRRRGDLRRALARAVPRRIRELGVEIDYIVIELNARRSIDAFISLT